MRSSRAGVVVQVKPDAPGPASHVILMCQPGAGEARGEGLPLDAVARRATQAAAGDMYGAGHHPGPLLVEASAAGREIAAIFAEVVHLDAADIHFSTDLAGATTDMLEVQIRPLAQAFTLVTLVAHNPGVSELVRILARDPRAPTLQPAQWRHLPWPPPY